MSIAGIGSRPPLTKVSWRVEFTQVHGGTYVARETALEPVDYGRDGLLTGFTVSFEELALSSGYRSSGIGPEPRRIDRRIQGNAHTGDSP
jgi:hypothetical protein